MLNVQNLNAWYGKSHIVRGVSLAAEPGRILGLLGRNGVGKTTIMRAIMGLVKRAGHVHLSGEEIGHSSPDHIAHSGVGYVPQGRLLFPHLTVEENLRLAWHKRRFNNEALNEVTSYFPRLTELLRRRAQNLSGGEQQMVAIGRALINKPKVILMDEPSEGLSPLFVDRVGEAVDKIKSKGVCIILVEQSLHLALACCDEFSFVDRGVIVDRCAKSDSVLPDYLERHLGVSAPKGYVQQQIHHVGGDHVS